MRRCARAARSAALVLLVVVGWLVPAPPLAGTSSVVPAPATTAVSVRSAPGPRCAGASGPYVPRPLRLVAGGRARTYFACLPARRGPVPLVVVVHGYTSSPRAVEAVTRWSALGLREGFATAYPVGVGESWDAGHCCGAAVAHDVDDVAFLDALPHDLARRTPLGRVYYAGFSNGAMLGLRLECGDQGPYRAFVLVAGTAVVPACRPHAPRAVLLVNGTADGLVPYAGCTVHEPDTGCAGVLHVDLPPVATVVGALRRAAGCRGTATDVLAPGVVRTDATGCRRPGPSVVRITGADHVWVTDAHCFGVDTTALAWAYLRRR